MQHSTARGGRRQQQPPLDRQHQQSGGRMRIVSRSRSRGRHPAGNGGSADGMGGTGGMRMNSSLVARSASPSSLTGVRGMMDGGNDDSMAYMIPGRAQMQPSGYQPRTLPEFTGASPRGRYSPGGTRSRLRRIGGPHGSPTSSHSPSRYYPGRGRIKHSATVPITHSRRINSDKSLMEMGHLADDIPPHRRIMGAEVHRDMRYRTGPYNPGGIPAKSMPLDGRMDPSSMSGVDCRPPGSRGAHPGLMPRDVVGDPMPPHHRYSAGPVSGGGPEAYVDGRGGPPIGMRGMGGGTPGGQSRRTTLTPRISDSAEKRVPSSGSRYSDRYDVVSRGMPDRGPETIRRNRSVMNDELSSPVSASAPYGNHSGIASMWRRGGGSSGMWMRSPPSNHSGGGGGSVVCRPYTKPMTTTRTDDILSARVQEMQVRLDEMVSENQVFRQVILDQTTRVWKLSQIVSRRGVDFCDDLTELSAQASQRPACRRSRKWRLVGGVRTALVNDDGIVEPSTIHASGDSLVGGEVVVGSSGGNTIYRTTPISTGDGDHAGTDSTVIAAGDESLVDHTTVESHDGAVVVTAEYGDANAASSAAVRGEVVVDAACCEVGSGDTLASSGSVTGSTVQLDNTAADSRPGRTNRCTITAPSAKRVATAASWAADAESDAAVATISGDEHAAESAIADSSKYTPTSNIPTAAIKYEVASPQRSLRTPSVYWVNCQTPTIDFEFRTIAEALIDVPPHSTILIREGLYIESITITNPIRLIGVGCDVQLLSDKGNGITVKCEGAAVQNLHIRCEYREFSLVHALDGEASRGLTAVSPCLNGVSSGPGVGLMGNHCVSIYAESFELDGCDLMTDRGHCIYCDPFGSASINRYGLRDRRSTAGTTDGDGKPVPSGDDKRGHNEQTTTKTEVDEQSYAEGHLVEEYAAVDEEPESNCDDRNDDDRRLSADSKSGTKDIACDIDVEHDTTIGDGALSASATAATFMNNDLVEDTDTTNCDHLSNGGPVVSLMVDDAHAADSGNADSCGAPPVDDNTATAVEGADNAEAETMNDDLAVIDNVTGSTRDGNNAEGTAVSGGAYDEDTDSVNSDVVEVVDFRNCTDQNTVLGNTAANNVGDQDDHHEHRNSYSSAGGRRKSVNSAAGDQPGYATPIMSSGTPVGGTTEEFNSEKYFASPSVSGYPSGLIVCKNSRVHHASSCGLFVTGRCRVKIENTAIEACRMAGVEARDRAHVTMSKCRITACTKSGVFGHGSAHVAMQATDVINCGMAGIELSKQSTGSLLDSRIYQGHKGGVFVHDYARASIKKCEIFANAMSNVDIRAHGKVEVLDSTISESKTSGVYVSNKGEAFLRRNFICRNWGNGIELNTASLTAYHNQVHENHRCALFANGDCGGLIQHNDFRWNSDKSLSNHSRGRLPADGENNFVDSGDRRCNNT